MLAVNEFCTRQVEEAWQQAQIEIQDTNKASPMCLSVQIATSFVEPEDPPSMASTTPHEPEPTVSEEAFCTSTSSPSRIQPGLPLSTVATPTSQSSFASNPASDRRPPQECSANVRCDQPELNSSTAASARVGPGLPLSTSTTPTSQASMMSNRASGRRPPCLQSNEHNLSELNCLAKQEGDATNEQAVAPDSARHLLPVPHAQEPETHECPPTEHPDKEDVDKYKGEQNDVSKATPDEAAVPEESARSNGSVGRPAPPVDMSKAPSEWMAELLSEADRLLVSAEVTAAYSGAPHDQAVTTCEGDEIETDAALAARHEPVQSTRKEAPQDFGLAVPACSSARSTSREMPLEGTRTGTPENQMDGTKISGRTTPMSSGSDLPQGHSEVNHLGVPSLALGNSTLVFDACNEEIDPEAQLAHILQQFHAGNISMEHMQALTQQTLEQINNMLDTPRESTASPGSRRSARSYNRSISRNQTPTGSPQELSRQAPLSTIASLAAPVPSQDFTLDDCEAVIASVSPKCETSAMEDHIEVGEEKLAVERPLNEQGNRMTELASRGQASCHSHPGSENADMHFVGISTGPSLPSRSSGFHKRCLAFDECKATIDGNPQICDASMTEHQFDLEEKQSVVNKSLNEKDSGMRKPSSESQAFCSSHPGSEGAIHSAAITPSSRAKKGYFKFDDCETPIDSNSPVCNTSMMEGHVDMEKEMIAVGRPCSKEDSEMTKLSSRSLEFPRWKDGIKNCVVSGPSLSSRSSGSRKGRFTFDECEAILASNSPICHASMTEDHVDMGEERIAVDKPPYEEDCGMTKLSSRSHASCHSHSGSKDGAMHCAPLHGNGCTLEMSTKYQTKALAAQDSKVAIATGRPASEWMARLLLEADALLTCSTTTNKDPYREAKEDTCTSATNDISSEDVACEVPNALQEDVACAPPASSRSTRTSTMQDDGLGVVEEGRLNDDGYERSHSPVSSARSCDQAQPFTFDQCEAAFQPKPPCIQSFGPATDDNSRASSEASTPKDVDRKRLPKFKEDALPAVIPSGSVHRGRSPRADLLDHGAFSNPGSETPSFLRPPPRALSLDGRAPTLASTPSATQGIVRASSSQALRNGHHSQGLGECAPAVPRAHDMRQRADKVAAEQSTHAKEREDSLLRMLDNRQQNRMVM
eukprot:gnl/MRDRNA2_/MRDRNA2_84527_c0_seq3.p1 gnl/MRDRNA2_/MRDRNA2_84527_c0~~gnl/MRDRNA2_/MRDRNA2_84527_c0_seq3.p1  ORF type:complete len:1267 (-),score=225.68 gnl/MRDRNA2_/MRDRNA2_84527_c0_seq3:46-3522(-)